MCLSIPSKVVAIDKASNTVTVDTMGVERSAGLDLMDDDSVEIGDFVLIHIGFVINKIDEADALATLEAYRDILEALDGAELEQKIIDDDNCAKR